MDLSVRYGMYAGRVRERHTGCGGGFFVCFSFFLFWLVVVNWSVGPSGMRLERPFHALNPCLFFLSGPINERRMSTHFFRTRSLRGCLWLMSANVVLMILFENHVTRLDVPASVERHY